jgi:hypothetical protein
MTNCRTAIFGAAVLATLLASPSASFAQGTAEQRSACTGDVFRLCSAEIPNVSRIVACMKANYSRLSPGCKAAVQ